MAWKKPSSVSSGSSGTPRKVWKSAQTDSLSAGAGRRRKVIACRAAEVVDGGLSYLRVEGQRRTQPRVRESSQSVRSGSAGTDDRGKVRHSAPSPEWADESLVLQAARSFRRGHFAIPRRQTAA